MNVQMRKFVIHLKSITLVKFEDCIFDQTILEST